MSSRPPAGVTTTHTLVARLDDIARGRDFFPCLCAIHESLSYSMRDRPEGGAVVARMIGRP